MATEQGVDKIRPKIETFCNSVKEDTEKIMSFFEAMHNAVKEDKTIERDVVESAKYKAFLQGIKELTKVIERIVETIEILKNMSHMYVFDFESFYDQLKEHWAVIDSCSGNAPENKESVSHSHAKGLEICRMCFHGADSAVEYKQEKYHVSCINYGLARIKGL